ncbi:MAG: hypothetical protein QXF69_05925 [Thermofilaceae archaeon]
MKSENEIQIGRAIVKIVPVDRAWAEPIIVSIYAKDREGEIFKVIRYYGKGWAIINIEETEQDSDYRILVIPPLQGIRSEIIRHVKEDVVQLGKNAVAKIFIDIEVNDSELRNILEDELKILSD